MLQHRENISLFVVRLHRFVDTADRMPRSSSDWIIIFADRHAGNSYSAFKILFSQKELFFFKCVFERTVRFSSGLAIRFSTGVALDWLIVTS